jgi:hypothetical protein
MRPPPPLKLPPSVHEIVGTIKSVAGHDFTLATRVGKLVHVDAATAAHNYKSVLQLVAEPVGVIGSYDSAGVLHAASVLAAKSSPKG